MGCSLSPVPLIEQWQQGEKPLTPRPTAPPPPPLTTVETTTVDPWSSCSYRSAVCCSKPVVAGLGASSAAGAAEAAREALSSAIASLSVAAGVAPTPSLAIVACSKAIDDAEEVRCELVRAMPHALLHGAASVATLFATPGTSRSRCGSAPMDAVGCLLLQAPEGSFASAWDDTGDAIYAAKWLQEQMPDPQAIIMATVPGQEESALSAVQSVFLGIPVYGKSAVDSTHWVTMSHLGSADHGISLVGIGVHVGFGAADAAPRSNTDLSASITEVYDAAMVAGCLKRSTAGILTCRGHLADLSFAEHLKECMGDIPVLAVTCAQQAQSLKHGPSIGLMLFGERQPQQQFESADLCRTACSTEDETASVSTAWPQSPGTDISVSEGTDSPSGTGMEQVEYAAAHSECDSLKLCFEQHLSQL